MAYLQNTSVNGTLGITGTTTARNIVPTTNGTYNLGSASYRWLNAYATTQYLYYSTTSTYYCQLKDYYAATYATATTGAIYYFGSTKTGSNYVVSSLSNTCTKIYAGVVSVNASATCPAIDVSSYFSKVIAVVASRCLSGSATPASYTNDVSASFNGTNVYVRNTANTACTCGYIVIGY